MLRTDVLKKHNLLTILKIIRQNKIMTKPQISKETNLAPATVHNLVNELLGNGIIIEEGIALSNGGRKASQYSLNTSKFYIIGVDMGIRTTTVILYDMAINHIVKFSREFKLSYNGVEEGAKFTINLIKDIIQSQGLSRDHILGIGVSMPGIVDFDKGIVIDLPNASNWHNVPLKQMVEKALGLPTIIDNDSNNSALFLKWQSIIPKNLVYISTTDGIGTGLIINNNVFRGENNSSGEIGHISVDIDGEKCNCGNNGCIEKYAADYAVVDTVKRDMKQGSHSYLREYCNNDPNKISMQVIVDAAKKDGYTKETLIKTSKYLCICINNTIKAFDPGKIVISSTWLGQFPDLFDQIRKSIYEVNNFVNRENVSIVLNEYEDIFVAGAAALVLDHNFNEYNKSRFLA